MEKIIKSFASICSLFFVGCSTNNIKDYQGTQPEISMETYFNGPMVAKGVFQKRGGQVSRKFVINMKGSWNGNKGVLEEDFLYDDGEKHPRVWKITKHQDGSYTGEADDIVGTAKGQIKGFAMQWKYTMALKVDGKVYHVDFDDWMYLVDSKTVINQSRMSKFGYELGNVLLSIEKE